MFSFDLAVMVNRFSSLLLILVLLCHYIFFHFPDLLLLYVIFFFQIKHNYLYSIDASHTLIESLRETISVLPTVRRPLTSLHKQILFSIFI
jgi:hypothetical protein